MELEKLVVQQGRTIIDVRTGGEFASGHVPGAVNIPLQDIPARMSELKAMSRPLILCCASGNRSGQATQYLLSVGLEEVYNGGSWMDVNDCVQNQNA